MAASLPSIKARQDFVHLRNKAFIAKKYGVIIQFLPSHARLKNNAAPCRYGITVTKKIGNAVIRNAVKRRFRVLLRDYYKQYGARMLHGDYVLIARFNTKSMLFSELEQSFYKAMRHIETYCK